MNIQVQWNEVVFKGLWEKVLLDFEINCNFLFFEPQSEKLFLNECQMAFRVTERKWTLSCYLNYELKEAFYFTLENVNCYLSMTVSFLGKWKLLFLDLVLITWISKLCSVILSYIIFPLYVGSVPYSASSLVSLFESVKRVHCDE